MSIREWIEEDGRLYYKLWLPLFDYINVKYSINKKGNMEESKSLNSNDVKKWQISFGLQYL